jgi:LmbE family N-acetylglucosaminyl deacetylase
MNSFKKILIISPHTDDGELGCGGAIAKFVEAGKEVFYVALSACEKSVPKEFPPDILKREVKKATGELGIKGKNLIMFDFEVRNFPSNRQAILDTLLGIKNMIKPDLVFTPSSYDTHQDHKVTREETLRAFKECTILGYEQPWNNISFDTDAFIKLEERHVNKKAKALQCYQSQSKRKYLNENFVRSLAVTRGVQINVDFAETFEVVRWVVE